MNRDVSGCLLTLAGAATSAGLAVGAWQVASPAVAIVLGEVSVGFLFVGVGGFSQGWNLVEMVVITGIYLVLVLLVNIQVFEHVRQAAGE
ncbi:MAG: hypothetical protein Q8P18_02830 [Pseudomonadota bacterium]|nr:hypothetical protein [Pseudomonadota bacterium]